MPQGSGFEQAYNAQAAVDMDSMLIIAGHVSQHTNDKKELKPVLDSMEAFPKDLGSVDALLADSGYFSEANVTNCEEQNITPYIAPNREGHNRSLAERFSEPPPLPDDADAVMRLRCWLKTVAGKAIYALQKSTVEPVFGIIKSVLGFDTFHLRSLESVTGEWTLACIGWNLKRLHTLKRA
ncbi:MAG: Transposase DDE domain protein [Syntrophorhabdus sp. PtaB.Bin006]|nr:MAG: Transposase DDE domain protein [Syntrophorhabdus sp. PtaB.Bin006]